jgi:hypothetical protein
MTGVMSLPPHDPWPTDAARAAAVVVTRGVIEVMGEEEQQELLIELECIAWPTAHSQTQ